jgi:hypothetical protein
VKRIRNAFFPPLPFRQSSGGLELAGAEEIIMRGFFGFLALLTCACAQAPETQVPDSQSPQLWEGAFDLGTMQGGLELRLEPQNGVAPLTIRTSPRGRFATPTPEDTTVTLQQIKFTADIEGVSYSFAGSRQRDGWTGTMSPAAPGAAGTWRVTRTALVAVPQPLDILPIPTGDFAVGRTAFHWVDDKRPELETKDPADQRNLLVYLFYPAAKSPSAQSAPYIPDGELMRSVWKDDLANKLLQLKTHTLAEAPVSTTRKSFPVLVFAPGGGQKALSYTALLEDLTSRGFIIAAIEFPHNAPAMQWPDGTVLTRAAPAERGWEIPTTREENSRIYVKQVEHWARDMNFVLDQLTMLNSTDKRFTGRLDLARVGALGHSKGGMAAGMVRMIDARFRAGMNMDGTDLRHGLKTMADGKSGAQPFLFLEKQFKWPTPEEFTQAGITAAEFEAIGAEGDRVLASISGGASHVVIAQPGLNHLDFGDYAFWTTTNDATSRSAKLRALRIVSDFSVAFFDGVLNENWRNYRQLAQDKTALPEVSVQHFGAAWGR